MDFNTNIELPSSIILPKTNSSASKMIDIHMLDNMLIDERLYNEYSHDIHNTIFCYSSNHSKNILMKSYYLGSLLCNESEVLYIPLDIQTIDYDYRNSFLYCFNQGLTTALRYNSYIIIHGNVLHINGKTIIIMAPSGAGKTTFTSFLVHNYGATLIADDIAAINTKSGLVYPGFATMKLWPDTIENIFNKRPQDFNHITVHTDKRYFPLMQGVLLNGYKIDAFIYLNHMENSKACLSPMNSFDTYIKICKNIYLRYILTNEMYKNELNGITSVLKGVTGYEVCQYRSYKNLNIAIMQLLDAIS